MNLDDAPPTADEILTVLTPATTLKGTLSVAGSLSRGPRLVLPHHIRALLWEMARQDLVVGARSDETLTVLGRPSPQSRQLYWATLDHVVQWGGRPPGGSSGTATCPLGRRHDDAHVSWEQVRPVLTATPTPTPQVTRRLLRRWGCRHPTLPAPKLGGRVAQRLRDARERGEVTHLPGARRTMALSISQPLTGPAHASFWILPRPAPSSGQATELPPCVLSLDR